MRQIDDIRLCDLTDDQWDALVEWMLHTASNVGLAKSPVPAHDPSRYLDRSGIKLLLNDVR